MLKRGLKMNDYNERLNKTHTKKHEMETKCRTQINVLIA